MNSQDLANLTATLYNHHFTPTGPTEWQSQLNPAKPWQAITVRFDPDQPQYAITAESFKPEDRTTITVTADNLGQLISTLQYTLDRFFQ